MGELRGRARRLGCRGESPLRWRVRKSTPISIFPHRGGRGKREKMDSRLRGKKSRVRWGRGKRGNHPAPPAVGSCFRRNDEVGAGMTRWWVEMASWE